MLFVRMGRFANYLFLDVLFKYKLVEDEGKNIMSHYREVVEKQEVIINVIQVEEERFHETLNDALDILASILEQDDVKKTKLIPGDAVFKLYDTYGFSKELTEEYVAEAGFTIDHAGFEIEMKRQQDRARGASQKEDTMQVQDDV